MKYKDKERIVSEAWFSIQDNDAWRKILDFGNLGFPMAYASQEGHATLDGHAQTWVTEVYDVLVEALDVPNKEYTSWMEMVDTSEL